MSILRVERRDRFAVIDQRTLRDRRISFRALGLLCHLLSHADGWVISMASLSDQRSEGRDAVRSAAKELREAGYLDQTREQNETGQWITVTTVREVANDQVAPKTGFQASDTRALDNRPSGEPTVGEPGDQRSTDQNDNPLPPLSTMSWYEDESGFTAYSKTCDNPDCVNGWWESERGFVPCPQCNEVTV